jgi:hypothetical protein
MISRRSLLGGLLCFPFLPYLKSTYSNQKHNVVYKHVNLLDAESVILPMGAGFFLTKFISDIIKVDKDIYLEINKEIQKINPDHKIICFVDERNNKYSLCSLNKEQYLENSFTDYIIFRRYQFTYSLGV